MSTSGGIQAGVMWTIVAGIQSFINDRWKVEPDATVVFTGGDGQVGACCDSAGSREGEASVVSEPRRSFPF